MLTDVLKVPLYHPPRLEPPISIESFYGIPAKVVQYPSGPDHESRTATVSLTQETVKLPDGTFTIESVLHLADSIRRHQAAQKPKRT